MSENTASLLKREASSQPGEAEPQKTWTKQNGQSLEGEGQGQYALFLEPLVDPHVEPHVELHCQISSKVKFRRQLMLSHFWATPQPTYRGSWCASSLAEDDDLFAPMLFETQTPCGGSKRQCSKRMSKKILHKLHKLWRQQPIFSRGRSHGNYQRGGGPNRRFQRSRKFQPYQKPTKRSPELPATPS